MGRLFGTDGIRGIANSDLTCETALRLGAAAARLMKKSGSRPVFAIGTDTRVSADMLAMSAASGLCAAGADVLMLGTIPTPGAAYLTTKYGCDAGIVISASHNPPEYNGIKLFSASGMKLPDELEERLEQLMEGDIRYAPPSEVGRAHFMHERAVSDYTAMLSAVAEVRLDGLRIAIDCANGAAAVTAEALFTSLGAEVCMLGCDISGGNINVGCGSTDMSALARCVTGGGFHAGVAFDGDADRCLMVDENGALIDGDMMLAICADDRLRRGARCCGIVGTVMSNLGLLRFCEERGICFSATKVGDRYVLEKMLQDGCALGGEQSGHIIFPEHSVTGDGQLTAIKLLTIMKRTGSPLSRLAAVMRRYPQHMVNIPISAAGKAAFYTNPEVQALVDEARAALNSDGRLLVRTSGTEPLLRIMTEAREEALAIETAEILAHKLQTLLN